MLTNDPGARSRVETASAGIVSELLPAAREKLSAFIAQVVGGWDAKTITDRLELRVGKYLQYVRMNGTLVGFIVGGLLYAVLRAGFGHASFLSRADARGSAAAIAKSPVRNQNHVISIP